jgi:hypothetical protein
MDVRDALNDLRRMHSKGLDELEAGETEEALRDLSFVEAQLDALAGLLSRRNGFELTRLDSEGVI